MVLPLTGWLQDGRKDSHSQDGEGQGVIKRAEGGPGSASLQLPAAQVTPAPNPAVSPFHSAYQFIFSQGPPRSPNLPALSPAHNTSPVLSPSGSLLSAMVLSPALRRVPV